VNASLDLQAKTSGRPFTYEVSQEVGEDGRFNLTVAYSTDDTVGPAEGGTDQAVEAVGSYTVEIGSQTTQVDVPEPAVLDGQPVPVEP
jgi:hypothetical protein